MKTLVEKEIRLLLPAFAGALALAILPIWLMPARTFLPGNDVNLAGMLYLFGAVILALSSFGREIGLKTLPFILAQPLERGRLWWTKITVLAVFAALAFDGWWLSGSLRFLFRPVPFTSSEFSEFRAGMGFFVIVFTAGGLWMALLVRQTVAAFWLTLLIPLAMVSGIKIIGGANWMVFTALGIYAVVGFFMARWQFLHVQDTAWTGGVLSFGRAKAVGESCALREQRPWAALFRKELQLQQITLMGIVCLLVLHLGVVFLRKAGGNVLGHTVLSALEMFGGLWLIVPFLAGSQSVADERQLGTLDGLLCLPFSKKIQFTVKLIFVFALGGLLSGALLCAVESFASALGVGARLGTMGITFTGDGVIFVCFAFLALSLIGFYASTLTRGIVPALGTGAVAAMVFWEIDRTASSLWAHAYFGWRLWPLMAFPALAVAFIWLAFGNFRYLFESGRRWGRNIVALITVLVVISASAAAVYHRIWELAIPLEEPHGPARLPLGKPVLFGGNGGNELTAVLPDGRLWVDRFTDDGLGKTRSYFVPGSNWVAATTHWRETIAIRSDGTLWVSEKPEPSRNAGDPPPLVQFGAETGWQSVVCAPNSLVILLRQDGTLWRWGTNDFNPQTYLGLRVVTPHRLGAKSDWVRILRGVRGIYAWERGGTAWLLQDEWNKSGHPMNGDEELAPGTAARRVPALDRAHFQLLDSQPTGVEVEAFVRGDGTLWYWQNLQQNPTQIGKDSDWVAVTGGLWQLAALKTDGSIWKWSFTPMTEWVVRTLQEAPVRLGTYHDWVGLDGWMSQVVTLSADGTLWRWPRTDPFAHMEPTYNLLAPSRRPAKIENIFDARE